MLLEIPKTGNKIYLRLDQVLMFVACNSKQSVSIPWVQSYVMSFFIHQMIWEAVNNKEDCVLSAVLATGRTIHRAASGKQTCPYRSLTCIALDWWKIERGDLAQEMSYQQKVKQTRRTKHMCLSRAEWNAGRLPSGTKYHELFYFPQSLTFQRVDIPVNRSERKQESVIISHTLSDNRDFSLVLKKKKKKKKKTSKNMKPHRTSFFLWLGCTQKMLFYINNIGLDLLSKV